MTDAPATSRRNVVVGALMVLWALGSAAVTLPSVPLGSSRGAGALAGLLLFGLAGARTLLFGRSPIHPAGVAPLHYTAKAALALPVLAVAAALFPRQDGEEERPLALAGASLALGAAGLILLVRDLREGARGDRPA